MIISKDKKLSGLKFNIGEFAGVVVESNVKEFRDYFLLERFNYDPVTIDQNQTYKPIKENYFI